MSFKEKLSKDTGIRKDLLPSSYQVIGNILLIKFMKIKSAAQKKAIAKALMKMTKVATVCEIKEVSGELREPKVVKLVGNGTETVHKEHNVLYKLDVSKIMFSKGNLSERKRLLDKIKPSETIVDMFAGIGYFSIPIAKFTKAAKIYAIEKNDVAFGYLKENIKLNKVINIEPINDDCRNVKIENADRILMGYFPNTEQFLPYALKMAKRGTIIHFHNIYRKDELWNKPLEDIKNTCEQSNLSFEVLEKKKVKSFAPNVFHVVIDFQVI
jgi:tRNA wybutosine-synthesizing protein 2